MANDEPTVFVLGAGFTKAFLPDSPLLTDYYDVEPLAEKFRGFAHASRILDWERDRAGDGRLNIERLMTRLDSLMPYDYDHGADQELGLLLTEVKKLFLQRLRSARSGQLHTDALARFASYCISHNASIITFNYDDTLDEALWRVNPTHVMTDEPYWHPDGGYGFFCRPAWQSVTQGTPQTMDQTSTLLLKLHGSMNWRVSRGYPQPYVIDAINHLEDWLVHPDAGDALSDVVSMHLESEPLLIPPVLLKSTLARQPVLRLTWNLAYEFLAKARRVVFVGYSFPVTDIAASALFQEALDDFPREDIHVVNIAETDGARSSLIEAYRLRFEELSEDQFDFRGALEWSQDL